MMQAGCTPPALDGPFVRDTLPFVDCQSRALGEAGFRALSASGGSVAHLLDVLLVLFLAGIGYRMILSGRLTAHDLIAAAVRIGVVLALATSWPAFRVLIFDVATRAPGEVAAEATRPLAPADAGGDLPDRMQAATDAIDRLLAPAPDTGEPRPLPSPATVSPATGTAMAVPPSTAAAAEPTLFTPLSVARMVFLATGLGAVAGLHGAIGLLLALAPLFACCLLLESSRGLFEGWLRALAGASLGLLAASVVLGMEAATLAPMLARLAALSEAGESVRPATVNLLLTTLLFAAAMIGAVWAMLRAAAGLRLPAVASARPEPWAGGAQHVPAVQAAIAAAALPMPAARLASASGIAEAMVALQRRDRVAGGVAGPSTPSGSRVARDWQAAPASPSPGQRTRPHGRVTTSGAQRDRDG